MHFHSYQIFIYKMVTQVLEKGQKRSFLGGKVNIWKLWKCVLGWGARNTGWTTRSFGGQRTKSAKKCTVTKLSSATIAMARRWVLERTLPASIHWCTGTWQLWYPQCIFRTMRVSSVSSTLRYLGDVSRKMAPQWKFSLQNSYIGTSYPKIVFANFHHFFVE